MSSAQPAPAPEYSIRKKLTLIDKTAPITQERLRKFYELQEHYEEEKRRFNALEEKFKREEEALALRTIGGAPIKTGQYRPSFKLIKIRHPRYKDALIKAKGEHYQKSVLENTKPSIHYYGHVE